MSATGSVEELNLTGKFEIVAGECGSIGYTEVHGYQSSYFRIIVSNI